MVNCTLTVAGDPCAPALWTTNEVGYCPGGSVDVLKVNVSVPVLTPVVGDTVSQVGQPPVGAITDHLRAALPAFLTCTVCDDALVPWGAWAVTEVGVTESTCCASATPGTSSAAKQSRRNLAARNRRGSVSMTCLVR